MISAKQLTVRSGDFTLSNVSFEVASGQYAALMGRTGSGKTTLLESICGLRSIVSGAIVLGDVDVTNAHPADRNIGYVPQEGALFWTMSVRDNMAFALDVRNWSHSDRDARVNELAQFLEITHLLDRRPAGLSGGERQRVALGRALAFSPSVLCMDEPLSALDDQTRATMYELLRSVREKTNVTVLHVTHSEGEAKALADVVLRLENGAVVASNIERSGLIGTNDDQS